MRVSRYDKLGDWALSDLEKPSEGAPTVFSCFSCGGGSTMGYKLAGYNVLGANDIDPRMQAIYVKNHKPPLYFLCPVKDLINQINKKEHPELFNLDVLDGSPPCSTFSVAGQREKKWGKESHFREGQAKQDLSNLFFDFIELADHLKPKVVISENVKGMLSGNAKGFVKAVLQEFDKIGYTTQIFLLNGVNLGCPQKRERVFFISQRKDLGLKEIHFSCESERWPTPPMVKDFIEVLGADFSKKAYDSNIQYAMLHKKAMSRGLYGSLGKVHKTGACFGAIRLKLNGFFPTMVSSPGCVMMHPDFPGPISDTSIRIAQSFPCDYDFGKEKVQYVCGMSVPPYMMRAVALKVKHEIL